MDVPAGQSPSLPQRSAPRSSTPAGKPPKSSPLREKSDSSSTISKISPRSTPHHRPTSNTFYASIYDLSRGSAKDREDEAGTNGSTYSEGSTPDTQYRIKSARGRLLKAKTTLSASMSNLQKKIPLTRKWSHQRNRSASDPVSSAPQSSTGVGVQSTQLDQSKGTSSSRKFDSEPLPEPRRIAEPTPVGSNIYETEVDTMTRLYSPNLESHKEEDPQNLPRPVKQKTTSSQEIRRNMLVPKRVKSKSDSEGSPPSALNRNVVRERSKYISPGASPSSSRGVSPAPRPQASTVLQSITSKKSPEPVSPMQRMAREGMTISPLRRGSSVPTEISSPTKKVNAAPLVKESSERLLKGHQKRRSSSPADLSGSGRPSGARQDTSNSNMGGRITPPELMRHTPSPTKQAAGRGKPSPNLEKAGSFVLGTESERIVMPPSFHQVETRETRRMLVFPENDDMDLSQYDGIQDENFWKTRAKELFGEIREERNRQRDMVELINSYERLRESSEMDVLGAFRAAESTMQRKEKQIHQLEDENLRLKRTLEESESARMKAMEDLSLLSIKYRDYFQRMQSDMTAALKEKDREIAELKTQNEEVKEQGEALIVAVMKQFAD